MNGCLTNSACTVLACPQFVQEILSPRLLLCSPAGQDLLEEFNGTERISYISADIVEWNYIPTETDQCSGEAFDEDTVPPYPP